MSSQKLLELVMIVKNSGEILRECLQKNRNFIDYWTIVDTGSTDNTPDIIREELKDIPGALHFSEFTNFSETRNKAFELANKKCKYMIVLDADSIMAGETLVKMVDLMDRHPKVALIQSPPLPANREDGPALLAPVKPGQAAPK